MDLAKRPRGLMLGDRPDRFGKIDDFGGGHQSHQRARTPATSSQSKTRLSLCIRTSVASSISAKSEPIRARFPTRCAPALREDPDVILVGEMRDNETIHLAISAAETGHLVFGTLHTNSAAESHRPHGRRFSAGAAGTDSHAVIELDCGDYLAAIVAQNRRRSRARRWKL